MVRQISAFRYSNKARCRQTFEINRLFKQKSNLKAGTNRKLQRRICHQLHNPFTSSTITAASPMKETQRRERTK